MVTKKQIQFWQCYTDLLVISGLSAAKTSDFIPIRGKPEASAAPPGSATGAAPTAAKSSAPIPPDKLLTVKAENFPHRALKQK